MILQLGRLENYQFNPYAIPYLIASVLMLLLGVYIFMHGGRTSQKWAFLNICTTFFLWLFGTFLVYSVKEKNLALYYLYVTYAGGCFISVSLYYYASVWLDRARKNWAWITLGFLTGFVFFLLVVMSHWVVYKTELFFWGYHSRLSLIGGGLFLLFFFTYLFLFFMTLLYAYREETDALKKSQVRLVGIAFFIATLGSSDLMPSYFGASIFPLGGLMMFGAVLTLAYTIIRYKLLDIETVIHKTIMWFCSTVIAILPFAAVIYFSQEWVLKHSSFFVTAYFLTVMLSFYFYLKSVQPRLDYVFRRRHVNLQAVLNRFSSDLAHLKNLRELLQGFVRMLRRGLYVRQISIYLKDASEEQYIPVMAKRVRGLKPFPVSDPFFGWIEKKDSIVVYDLAQSDPEIEKFKEVMTHYFKKVEAKVVMPFVLGGKLIGFVNLGRKENLKRYTSEEIQFLLKLKSPMAIAFSNSLQFIAMQEKLKKWNEELERKVKERTQELSNTQAQLVQAEKLATIGTLAGGVAHEINNPLTAVLTNAQILKMSANPEDMESLTLIEEGAKRCQAIIQKLMKYARKPTGQLETLSKVDINKAVENALAFLSYQLKQENIELRFQKKEGLHSVEGNSNELEQVFTNLILNSKDAIKQGARSGVIEIKTGEQNGSVHIIVEDNGVGISKENLGKIFDPFFTTKEIGKGTGLGLAVTYGIIEKHKGKIEVSSQIGKGTVFLVSFPKKIFSLKDIIAGEKNEKTHLSN